MQSFESMKRKLKPLGLYRLEENTAVSAELSAYAAGLDVLYDILEEMEREAFTQTAESYGLSERERFAGVEQKELSTEKRRELLIGAEQTLGLSGTPRDFEKYLRAIGLEQAEIVERPRNSWLQIFVSDRLSEVQIKAAAEKILKAAPPHINVTASFLNGVEFNN